MDAHFNEYLAAVAGMAEVYGGWNDESHLPPGISEEGHVAEPLTAAV
ncbi:MAG: hypothetical protein KGR24_00780 [Planctomycetes bacterium]|nr:hypothetical protein [Planctomycetota bacterium]